jgi:hypothetical protein
MLSFPLKTLMGFLMSDGVDGAKSDGNDTDDGDSTMLAEEIYEINQALEKMLSNKSFLSCFTKHYEVELSKMDGALQVAEEDPFRGILVDTGARGTSIISIGQYRSYFREHGVPAAIEKSERSLIKGIGESRFETIGTTTILVPLLQLDTILTIRFKIIPGNGPALLCINDLRDNGLYISVQTNEISRGNKYQPLTVGTSTSGYVGNQAI